MNRKTSGFKSVEAEDRFYALYDAVLNQWPVSYEERDVPTRYGETHLVISGPEDAPPLILLPGGMATAVMWWKVIGDLSRTYRCHCVDTIGDPGRSIQSQSIRSFNQYMEWLEQVLDELGIGEARLAGKSHGGAIAANFALRVPTRVSRLVLLCPAAMFVPMSARILLKMLPARLLRSESLIRKALSSLFYHKTEENLSHPVTSLIIMGVRDFTRKGSPIPPMPPVLSDEELRRIEIPTTVLIGNHESIYRPGPLAALERAERLMPNVRTHLIERAGHVLHVDNPEAVVEKMLEGLA